MVVWGGHSDTYPYDLDAGGRYDPATDSWTTTSTTGAPSARGYHSAVWTGTQMLVWGGYDDAYTSMNTGGAYNPALNLWTSMSTINAPSPRVEHTATWAADRFIVWGGYDPENDTIVNTGVTWMLDQFKPKKVGYIYQEGLLGTQMGDGLKKALTAKGMTIAAEAGYKPGDIDFSSQVARMKAADVDLIVIATITRETIGIMSEVKKLGWNNVKVLTGNPGRTGIVLQLGKDNVEGLYGVGTWKLYTATNGPDSVKKWFADYKKKYTNEPDENALLSYAYTDIFVKAVQAAGRDLSADKVVKALQTMTFEHPIFYDKQVFKGGHFDPEYVEIDQIKGGAWVSLTKPMK